MAHIKIFQTILPKIYVYDWCISRSFDNGTFHNTCKSKHFNRKTSIFNKSLCGLPVKDSIRDPRTAWCAHWSVRVGAIFFGLIGAGAVRVFVNVFGAGAVRCEFLKIFVVLVRCGPNF